MLPFISILPGLGISNKKNMRAQCSVEEMNHDVFDAEGARCVEARERGRDGAKAGAAAHGEQAPAAEAVDVLKGVNGVMGGLPVRGCKLSPDSYLVGHVDIRDSARCEKVCDLLQGIARGGDMLQDLIRVDVMKAGGCQIS